MANYLEVEPIFLKIKGGWINPVSIMRAETYRQNEAMLSLGLVGLERPIILNEADSAYVTEYLESRTWHAKNEREPGGFVEDRPAAIAGTDKAAT